MQHSMPRHSRSSTTLKQERTNIPTQSGEIVTVRVWDRFIRFFHWTLALSFAVAWLSAWDWEDVHAWAGYCAGALVLARAGWGIIGTPYARFSQFLRPPRTVLAYLVDIGRGREARHVGHNPAGGAMVIALMLTMLATAITGWMLTTDAFWGDRKLQHIHHYLAHGLVLLVCVHLAGVLVATLRHRENLVAAMISGRKRLPEGDLGR